MEVITVTLARFLSQFCFKPELEGYLGLEQEVWTIDPRTRQLVAVAPRIFSTYPEGKIKPELPVHQVEIVTDPCQTVVELIEDLAGSYDLLGHYAQEFDFIPCFDSLPPSDFEVDVYPKPRYLRIQEAIGNERLRNGWITGIHIHYGCRNFEQAIALLNGFRPWVEYLSDLSSPNRTSKRLEIYKRMCTEIVPPVIDGVNHLYEVAVDRGFVNDPHSCWWGIRINSQGTVEVRVFDNGPDVDIGYLASTVKALAGEIL